MVQTNPNITVIFKLWKSHRTSTITIQCFDKINKYWLNIIQVYPIWRVFYGPNMQHRKLFILWQGTESNWFNLFNTLNFHTSVWCIEVLNDLMLKNMKDSLTQNLHSIMNENSESWLKSIIYDYFISWIW